MHYAEFSAHIAWLFQSFLALTQRLLTLDTNVRHVKRFFSIKRSKFGARVPLPGML